MLPGREVSQWQCYRQHLPGFCPSHPVGQLGPAFRASKAENEKGKCVLSPFINNQKSPTQVTLSEHPPLPCPSICCPQPLAPDGAFQPGRGSCPTQQFCPSPSSATHRTESHRNEMITLYFYTHGALILGSVLWAGEGGNGMGTGWGRAGACFIYKIKPCSSEN